MRWEPLLVLGSVLFVLAVGELGLLFLPKFEPAPRAYVGSESSRLHQYLMPDTDLGWRMFPDRDFTHESDDYSVAYHSNSLGFRDGRHSRRAPEHRIAIVGDSFSFGYGVEFDQTFGALVEARLPGTVVHNFALPGYGIDQMWLSARKYALAVEPALLIVAFISDDFTRSLTAHRYNMGLSKPAFELENGALRPQTPEDGPPRWLWYVLNHSRLWAGEREMMRLIAHYYPIGEWWHLNRALLEAIREDGQAAGARVLFVYLFTREPRPFPALGAHMKASSADFIDLDARWSSRGHALTFSADRHPNPEGNRYVADAVMGWIEREMPELQAGRM